MNISKNYFKEIVIMMISLVLISCDQDIKDSSVTENINKGFKIWEVDSITELSDKQYPNNPDISIRSKLDGLFSHKSIEILRYDANFFSIKVFPANNKSDTILLDSIKLLEWIPSVPKWVKEDEYLTHLGIVNQEWNRMQVNFTKNQFKKYGDNLEQKKLTRIDLARNCINAYLWEIIFYTKEDGKNKPCYHGWFNFPKDLYAQLFKEKNNLNYEQYKDHLENWIDPESKKVDLSQLRYLLKEWKLPMENYNNKLYPLSGERKKKGINIISPKSYNSIQDFLTNKTTFATFSAPGFYNQKDPRNTQLSRLANPVKVLFRETSAKNKDELVTNEIEIVFEKNTKLIIGGILKSLIPTLSIQEVNKGWQMPMGIANHSFYSNYNWIKENTNLSNPYYAFLLDSNDNWLDSHTIGIDGPLLHYDINNPNILHIWILSFERHCFVGHYTIDITKIQS